MRGELVTFTSRPGGDEVGSEEDICTKSFAKFSKKSAILLEPKAKVWERGTMEPSPEIRYEPHHKVLTFGPQALETGDREYLCGPTGCPSAPN